MPAAFNPLQYITNTRNFNAGTSLRLLREAANTDFNVDMVQNTMPENFSDLKPANILLAETARVIKPSQGLLAYVSSHIIVATPHMPGA